MKKICSIIALLFLGISLTGCGGQKDSGESTWKDTQTDIGDLSAVTDRTEYYDVTAEQELIFQWGQEKERSPLAIQRARFIGMQFYQGEPVQLWVEPKPVSYGEKLSQDLCLYRSDGSREVIVQGIDAQYPYHGYLDQEGNLYWWHNPTVMIYPDGGQEKVGGNLKKYLKSGEAIFDKQLSAGQDILDIRQTAGGRIYLTIRDMEDRWLAELDPATGLITKCCNGQPIAKAMDNLDLGIYGDKPAAWFGSKAVEINADDGTESCILSLQGTSYIYPENYRTLQDFRILEDGSVEILWAVSNGSGSLREKLRMARVEKIPIVLRAWVTGSWLEKRINSFNRSSETYHVIVENQASDQEDFARLTSVQIASGKGPDILLGSLMQDYISGMIEKGALEDLRSYMEESGIREEDYFPYVFATWRSGGKIYGINPAPPWLTGYRMDSSVLGGTEEPDIETLVDILLARQEDAVFLDGYDSQALLELLLRGTDTLWGMVDWEKGSCDFSGGLFAEILETARRYGDNGGSGGKTCLAEPRHLGDIFHFDSLEDRARDKKVICGVLFDDGCHAAVTSNATLAVNANSSNKEGAWEFISFLLQDRAQSDTGEISLASRNAFDIWVGRQREEVADGREIHELRRSTTRLPDGNWTITEELVFTEDDITEERIEEYLDTLEDARPYPLRTAPVLDIISEEAAGYFNGSKSAAEVARLVANRVQLYLDERK